MERKAKNTVGLRFRQTFTLFPGVRLNLSKTGLSASIGVPGATINFSKRGVRSTVGIPGTGLSYSQMLTSGANDGSSPISTDDPAPEPVYYLPQRTTSISSAPLNEMSHDNLAPLRDMILAAHKQRSKVDDEVREAETNLRDVRGQLSSAESLHNKATSGHERASNSFFRRLLKKRIARLANEVAGLEELVTLKNAKIKQIEEHLVVLRHWRSKSCVEIEYDANEMATRYYANLVVAFAALIRCARIWDITEICTLSAAEQVAMRSSARQSNQRKLVDIGWANSNLIRFEGKALRFGNANGNEMLLYPGMMIVPDKYGHNVALLDLKHVDVKCEVVNFQEEEALPHDAVVVGHTWTRANRDGSRDLRFAENQQIPICAYGKMHIKSDTGLNETFLFSNPRALGDFLIAYSRYRVALVGGDVDKLVADGSL